MRNSIGDWQGVAAGGAVSPHRRASSARRRRFKFAERRGALLEMRRSLAVEGNGMVSMMRSKQSATHWPRSFEKYIRGLRRRSWKQKAAAAADAAAKAASRAALFSVLALALGALAGWFGGRAGAVDPTLTTRARGRQRGS
jgi:hypothetical protein